MLKCQKSPKCPLATKTQPLPPTRIKRWFKPVTTDFQIKRSDLKKYISNASEILRQARMVPNIVPGSDGQVEGFRFVSIQPNSIYSKLGLKVNDTIKAVNGQPVNSPSRGHGALQRP